ncbi:hypothetical protein PSQ19_10550 [Devosia algicola]|uniref:Uncharacterized protein n=1 Tax=Devosia algicola TaxID=3026418 RepID=A0ABY7YJ43_9HYPH|nr:hypothetical protein [Devosia algicola]WDR01286.1 hypothetical protein PSQ19_10550 [Devosia algicola]
MTESDDPVSQNQSNMIGRMMNIPKFTKCLATGAVFALALTSVSQAQVGTVSWLKNGEALNASLHGLGSDQLDRFLAWCQPEPA